MKEMLHLAEERHRDGTTIDYYFHKSTGHFYCVVHGFATGQNNSNRSSRLTNIQTIDDLVEYLKKRNVKWSDEAKEFFDELKEGNKMSKLTEEQRSKVKKFISKLKESKIIKENNTYTMISALREIADDLLLNTELLIDNHYGKLDHEQFKNQWYKASNAFEAKFKTIIKNLMKAGK